MLQSQNPQQGDAAKAVIIITRLLKRPAKSDVLLNKHADRMWASISWEKLNSSDEI
jgi:hypothetical protein